MGIMQSGSANKVEPPKAWVYRDVKHVRCAYELVRELERSIAELETGTPNCSRTLDALLCCGELECALADLDRYDQSIASELTDCVAAVLVSRGKLALRALESRRKDLLRLGSAGSLSFSAPEGFAYYALHPLDFAEATRQLPVSHDHVAVIGIRSIGTVLSAVVAAAFITRKITASRITTRPSGHPYDRNTRFTHDQLAWIRHQQLSNALFLVVDEGPGLSGSSFLSVAESLLEIGIPAKHILMLGSRAADPQRLCARNAKARWARFQFRAAEPIRYATIADGTDISGGRWRKLLPPNSAWPACWPQMERLKFVSQEQRLFSKFEGIGRWGRTAYDRACRLAGQGFTPSAERVEEGLISYSLLNRSAALPELSASTLKTIAEYCAFRAKAFRIDLPSDSQFEAMVRFNAEQELGFCPDLDFTHLTDGPPVIVDGRMHPHEWILCDDGHLLKTDAVSHGDDHLFPGPVDIAWDLAGAIVEWNMPDRAAHALLWNFAALSGDDARRRIAGFIFAYSIFRTAYNRLALSSLEDPDERARLLREHRRYKVRAESVLQRSEVDFLPPRYRAT